MRLSPLAVSLPSSVGSTFRPFRTPYPRFRGNTTSAAVRVTERTSAIFSTLRGCFYSMCCSHLPLVDRTRARRLTSLQGLEEARIAKLEDEVRQAEERWQGLSKKLSGKELEKALAAGRADH